MVKNGTCKIPGRKLFSLRKCSEKSHKNRSRRGEHSQNHGEQQELLEGVTHSMDSTYLYKSSRKTSELGIRKPADTASTENRDEALAIKSLTGVMPGKFRTKVTINEHS